MCVEIMQELLYVHGNHAGAAMRNQMGKNVAMAALHMFLS
jgi:hypothetical protein